MILRTDATHMEQAQERLGSKRETESVGVGVFVTASEVGRMKNPGNMDRGIHVPLKLTHAPISPTQVLLGAEQDLAEAGARAERFNLRHSHEMPLQGGRFRPHLCQFAQFVGPLPHPRPWAYFVIASFRLSRTFATAVKEANSIGSEFSGTLDSPTLRKLSADLASDWNSAFC